MSDPGLALPIASVASSIPIHHVLGAGMPLPGAPLAKTL